MEKKLIVISAIAVVAILVTTSAFVVLRNDGGEGYSYDTSKGWYSWDPIALETKSAYYSITPLLVEGTELLYKGIYGKDVDISGYNLSDIPSDFLSYDSLVVSKDATTVTIKSTIRDTTAPSGRAVVEVATPRCPDNLLTTAGYAATLYNLLKLKTGDAAQAESQMWNYIFGLDKSAFPGASADMSKLYGLTIPSGVVKVVSTYDLVGNSENYIDYINDGTSDGKTIVTMMAGSLKQNYSELGGFNDIMSSKGGAAAALFFFSNNIGDVLAAVEVIGAVYDLEDQAKQFIDNLRLEFYAMNQEAIKQGVSKTVYLEANTGTSAGRGTITQGVFEVLNLTNINTSNDWSSLSEETIIDSMPDVIIFYDTNKKTWDERMRVGVDAGATTNS